MPARIKERPKSMEQQNQEQQQCWSPVDELLRKPPFPPREENSPLDLLVSSVRLHGILSPVLARRQPGGAQVVCGYRRLLAARTAGLREVPVLLASLEDSQAIRCYLAENMCRQTLGTPERETALQLLKELRDGGGPRAPGRMAPLPAEPCPEIDSLTDMDLAEERRDEIRALVDGTEALFSEARGRKRVDVEKAEELVSRLIGMTDAHRPLRADELYRGDEKSWLAQHSLLVASLNAALVPSKLAGLGSRGYALAGLLHDVGMVFIDGALLSDKRALGPKQRRELHSHTRIGHALLTAAGKEYAEIALVARDHHERLDGSGYPNGLRGNQLGRLILLTSLVDSYASMVAPRPYRSAMTPGKTLERLARATDMGLYDAGLFPLLHEVCQHSTPEAGERRKLSSRERWGDPSRKRPLAVEIY